MVALPSFTPRALAEWQRFIKSDPANLYGLDVETSAIDFKGLGAFAPDIKTRLIQFGTKSEAWVLPVTGKWRGYVSQFLRSSARFVSHNAAFDATRVLHEFGIDLAERSIDTLPMAALRWPGRTKPKDLKTLASFYISGGLEDAEDELHAEFIDLFYANKPRKTPLLPKSFEHGVSPCRKPRTRGKEKCQTTSWAHSRVGYCREHYLARKPNKTTDEWGWNNIPIDNPAYLQYGGLDAIYVRWLVDVLADEIKRLGMAALSRKEQRVKRISVGQSRRGMLVDKEWTKPILDEVGREYDAVRDRVEEATGFVPGSTYLRDWLRERDVVFEKLDKKALPDLILTYGKEPEVGPVLRDLLEVSQRKNVLTNLRTIWKHATEGDGFVHPNINTMQAHTGRMSYTSPAMQTFKKSDPRLRGCFIARPGHVLVGADYNSQEIRIAAALSRDPMYLKIVNENLNQHVLTAMSLRPATSGAMFALCPTGGCGECEACSKAKKAFPDEYHNVKILDFMQQYSGGPRKIAATLEIEYAEALAMWKGWRATYAGLVAWSERMSRHATVVNPFGRVIPKDPMREYANANYLIQSSGRDMLGESLCILDDHGYGDKIWMTIHDEIVLEVDEFDAEQAAKDLGEHMTFQFGDILIPAEGEIIGKRWGGHAA